MPGPPRPPAPDAADGASDSGSTELPMTDLSAAPGTADDDRLMVAIAKAPFAPPPKELEAGAVVGHGFRIERRLGAGGMGVVYLARDMTLERDVALKVHRAHAGVDRLQREAVAMARLAHPNVITVHEIGRIDDRLFVAMEYVAGHTLRDWMLEKRTWREVVAMMRQVGEGLCAAHDAGLVHRDFKPENVLVGPDGRPRVGDFGLVRVVGGPPSWSGTGATPPPGRTPTGTTPTPRAGGASAAAAPAGASIGDTDAGVAPTISDHPLETAPTAPPRRARRRTGAAGPESATLVPANLSTEEPDGDRLTATGAVLGTPAYMAPEQFAGERVDARADQFAFSAVLYEALWGQRPFAGRTPGEILRNIESGQARPLPPGRRVPRWLRRVIDRGLALEPAHRYPDLRALLVALERGTRRRARIAAVAALAAAAAIAAIAVVAGGRAGTTASPCAGAGRDVEGLWSPASHARLTAAATAADADLGPRIAASAADRLDDFRTAYLDAAGRACLAREVEQTWDDELYRRSRGCLDGAAAAVRDLLALPLHGRRDLSTLANLVSELPSPELCKRPAQLARGPAGRHGLVTGELAVAIYHVADRMVGNNTHVLVDDGLLARLQAAAAPLGEPQVDAHLRLAAATSAMQRADFARAQSEGEAAFAAARAAGDDADAMLAAVLLLRVLGVEQTKFDAARPWMLQALADASRPAVAAEEAYLAAGSMAERQAHYDEAIDLEQKAVHALEDRGEADSHDYAFALDQLAAALDESGRSSEAITVYRRAIELNTRRGGPDFPGLISDYTNLSLALSSTGELAGAVDAARHALTLARQWQDSQSPDVLATAYLNLGAAYLAAGNAAAGATALELARARYLTMPGNQNDSLAIIESDLAFAHVSQRRYDEALAEIQAALRHLHELGQDESLETAQALSVLADIQHHLGRCREAIASWDQSVALSRRLAPARADWTQSVSAEAACLREVGRAADSVAELERAVAALEAHPMGDRARAQVVWQLAAGLHAVGKDPARARALVAEAAALYQHLGSDGDNGELAEIAQALASWP